MISLIRKAFPNIPLDATTLASWIESWLAWRALHGSFMVDGEFQVVFEISCIPEADLKKDAERIRSIASPLFTTSEIIGNDTVRAISKSWPAKTATHLEETCALIISAAAPGKPLAIEIITRRPVSHAAPEHLVFYCLAENNSLTLKAIWLKHPPHDDGKIYQFAVSPDEDPLIATFRRSAEFERLVAKPDEHGRIRFNFDDPAYAGAVAVNLRILCGPRADITLEDATIVTAATARQLAHAAVARELPESTAAAFSPIAAKQGSNFVKIVFGFGEKFSAFAFRAAAPLAIAVFWFWVWLRLRAMGIGLLVQLLSLLAGILFAALFLFVVGWKANLLYLYRKQMRAGMRKLYSEPLRLTKLDSLPAHAAADPTLQKWTADLIALGGQHVLDLESELGISNLARIFYFPQHHAYFQLLGLFSIHDGQLHFPANANFLVVTYFPNAITVTTSNAPQGFRRQLDKRSLIKFLPHLQTPRELIEKHFHLVSNFKTTAQPLRFTADEFLARIAADHVEFADRMRRYGYYRWPDAFREVFRLVRREYKS